MLVGKRKRYGVVEHAASLTLVTLGVGSMVFAAMSDSFWMSLFGFLATAFGLWLTYKKAADAQVDAAKAKEKAEESARTAVVTGDKSAVAIESVSEANKVQHKLMNSQLEEMKKIIFAAAKAEGIVQGRADVMAEHNAEAAAMAKGAREAMPTLSPSALPEVSNVPAAEPLPVEVTDKKE